MIDEFCLSDNMQRNSNAKELATPLRGDAETEIKS